MIFKKRTYLDKLPLGTEIYRNKHSWRVQLRNRFTGYEVIRVYGVTLEEASKNLLEAIK